MKHKNSKQHVATFKARRIKNRVEGCCVVCQRTCEASRCDKHAVAHAAYAKAYRKRKKDKCLNIG